MALAQLWKEIRSGFTSSRLLSRIPGWCLRTIATSLSAPHLSPRAKMIKIADKMANLGDLMDSPPADWPLERKIGYLEWSNAVVDGCRGQNVLLDRLYDWVAWHTDLRLKRVS